MQARLHVDLQMGDTRWGRLGIHWSRKNESMGRIYLGSSQYQTLIKSKGQGGIRPILFATKFCSKITYPYSKYVRYYICICCIFSLAKRHAELRQCHPSPNQGISQGKGMESANNDASKWPILPFDVSRDFIISNEFLVQFSYIEKLFIG